MIRTYIAFDTKDSAALVKKMKTLGVNIGTCGVRTVRLRPMLVFEEAHSKSSHKKFRTNAFSHDSVKLTIFFLLTVPYLIESLDKALGSA
jgi:4-aminobutyrate aminotransferase/(S)-3-amino-2-methylpropionate transaminase